MTDNIEGVHVTMVVDENGESMIPSAVHIPKNGNSPIVGVVAVRRAERYPERTFYDSKRAVTKDYDDPAIQEYKKVWPF